MRGVVHSLSHLCSMLLVSLLAHSPCVLWAQRISTPESVVQLPDAPSQVEVVSKSQADLHLTYKGLLLDLKKNQGQTESWMRFVPDHTDYDPLSSNTKAALGQEHSNG
jgi:hypothetical protein